MMKGFSIKGYEEGLFLRSGAQKRVSAGSEQL